MPFGSGRFGAPLAYLLIIAAVSVMAGMMYRNRDRYDRHDFIQFWNSGQKLRLGGDPWRTEAAVEANKRGSPRQTYVFAYPPAFLWLFAQLTRLPQQKAYWLWQTIQLAALTAALLLTLGELGLLPNRELTLSLFALGLLYPQLYTSLHWGQPTCLLLFLLVMSWVCARHGRNGWAGFLLATGALLKGFPAAAAGYFLFRRRWKVVGACLLWGFAGVAILFALGGMERTLDFFHGSETSAVWAERRRGLSILANVRALVIYLYDGRLPSSGLALIGALVALCDLVIIAVAALFTWNADEQPAETDGLNFNLWVMTAMLISPLAWDHYTVLLLPMYFFVAAGLIRGVPRLPWMGVAMVALGLLGFIVPLYYHPLREHHAYFFALLVSFAGVCLMLAQGHAPSFWAPRPFLFRGPARRRVPAVSEAIASDRCRGTCPEAPPSRA